MAVDTSLDITRAFALTAAHDRAVAPHIARDSDDKAGLVQTDIEELSLSRQLSGNPVQQKSVTMKSRLRTGTPFILAHDILRGVLYALQMLVIYLLMLAVMYAASFLTYTFLTSS